MRTVNIAILFGVITSVGCQCITLPENNEYAIGLEIGKTYILTKDSYLRRIHGDSFSPVRDAVVPFGWPGNSEPRSLDELRNNKKNGNDIIGVERAGSKLTLVRLDLCPAGTEPRYVNAIFKCNNNLVYGLGITTHHYSDKLQVMIVEIDPKYMAIYNP